MAGEKPDVLMVGARKPVMMKGFEGKVNLHHWLELKDKDAFVKENGGKIRAIAIAYTANKVDENFLKQFPKLEQVSSFGVGYDHIDAKWAGAQGITVTNTPDVLNEEVADTARGKMAAGTLSTHQGDAARPHGRNGRNGSDRQGYCPAARGVRCAGRLSQPQSAVGCDVQVLSEAYRHGPRRRHAHGDRAWRRLDPEHDQRRSAESAWPARRCRQYGAWLGGR